ncbi:MAG TPA: PEPxxWA-CTERM sorting domain-containing protein [Rhizomicrobium sp.]|nr:PEPxxWA-CTERM sorting domain-containing protein [Rhizomicrobium sp.]
MAIAAGTSSPASATLYGTNLIVNGDAEANTVTDFTVSPGFQTLGYAFGGGFPVAGDPGVSEGGNFFFWAGNTAVTTASQLIDLSSIATAIDTGTVGYTLSALLGGYLTQNDDAALSLSFLDTGSLTLGGGSTGIVTAADRSNLTALLERSIGGFLPTGTRSIEVLLTQRRFVGDSNDGYADNLSLVLKQAPVTSAVPEPATWAMMLAGFGALGGVMRRRQRVVLHFA